MNSSELTQEPDENDARDKEKEQKHITVWRFEDAPEELRDLSTNGSDEDWIAEVPPYFNGEYINWLDNGTGDFGCFSIDTYPHPSKPMWTIYIGCHA